MFEDSLFESSGRLKTKKKATVFASFILQCGIIGIMILVPLIYTEALPKRELLTFLMAPPPPPPPPPPPQAIPKVRIIPKVAPQPQEFVQPKAIPKQIAMIKEEPPPPTPVGGVVGGVAGGMAGGAAGGILGGMITAAAPPPPPPPPPPPERVRVGGSVAAAKLIAQPKPQYPPLARQARIQGTVKLEADISKEGTIENLRVISGHPLLIQAAIDAVKQWRYQPTMLNGVPVEVVTTVDVNFTLGG